jgi:hypothetical protein
MPILNINGQVIDFPASAASPNWAPAIIQFAQAVESALAISVGTYDVSPQTMLINIYNSASDVNINALSFPTSDVRSVFIRYSVFRTTSTNTAYEAGDMIAMYNPNNPVTEKWTLTLGNRTGGGAQISFSVTDTGQFRFSTTALPGSSHTGQLTFEARALEQT